jgi:hypothetical protein
MRYRAGGVSGQDAGERLDRLAELERVQQGHRAIELRRDLGGACGREMYAAELFGRPCGVGVVLRECRGYGQRDKDRCAKDKSRSSGRFAAIRMTSSGRFAAIRMTRGHRRSWLLILRTSRAHLYDRRSAFRQPAEALRFRSV